MKYLVMETHLAFAVVLDENGSFMKVANLRYETGQVVTEVFPMQTTKEREGDKDIDDGVSGTDELRETAVKSKRRQGSALRYLAAAAGLAVMVTAGSVYRTEFMTWGSVYMSINPDICINVNSRDRVISLEPLNDDGKELISGYSHKNKDLDRVVDEISDRAIDQGYLSDGGTIRLDLSSDHGDWSSEHGKSLGEGLRDHISERISVTIEIGFDDMEDIIMEAPSEPEEVLEEPTAVSEGQHRYVIPIGSGETGPSESADVTPHAETTAAPKQETRPHTVPQTSAAPLPTQPALPQTVPDQGDSGYGVSSYGDSNYGNGGYGNGDSEYGSNDGDSDFD